MQKQTFISPGFNENGLRLTAEELALPSIVSPERIRREAGKLKRTNRIGHGQALNEAARLYHYNDFRHAAKAFERYLADHRPVCIRRRALAHAVAWIFIPETGHPFPVGAIVAALRRGEVNADWLAQSHLWLRQARDAYAIDDNEMLRYKVDYHGQLFIRFWERAAGTSAEPPMPSDHAVRALALRFGVAERFFPADDRGVETESALRALTQGQFPAAPDGAPLEPFTEWEQEDPPATLLATAQEEAARLMRFYEDVVTVCYAAGKPHLDLSPSSEPAPLRLLPVVRDADCDGEDEDEEGLFVSRWDVDEWVQHCVYGVPRPDPAEAQPVPAGDDRPGRVLPVLRQAIQGQVRRWDAEDRIEAILDMEIDSDFTGERLIQRLARDKQPQDVTLDDARRNLRTGFGDVHHAEACLEDLRTAVAAQREVFRAEKAIEAIMGEPPDRLAVFKQIKEFAAFDDLTLTPEYVCVFLDRTWPDWR